MVGTRRADPQLLTTRQRPKFAASSNFSKVILKLLHAFFSASTTALILISKLAAPHQPSKNEMYLDRYRRWKFNFLQKLWTTVQYSYGPKLTCVLRWSPAQKK